MGNKIFLTIIAIILLIFISGLVIFFILNLNKNNQFYTNKIYTNKNRKEKVKTFNDINSIDETKQKNTIILAKRYYEQKEFDRALTLLDELFINYGENIEALTLQQEILKEKQNNDNKNNDNLAIKNDIELSTKSDEFPFIIRRGGATDSGTLSENEKTTAEKIDSLINQGINEYNVQNYAKAKSSFLEVLKINGDNPEANGYLSATLFDENPNDQNNIDESIKRAKKSLKNDPNIDIAHLTLARIYEKINSLDLSISEYKILLSIKPDNYEIHNAIGKLYYKKGDYANAKNEFQRTISINSDYINGYYNLGVVLQKTGNTEESAEFYKKALSLDQNYIFALINLANIYFENENYREALSLYERGNKISNQSYISKKIGECYAKLNQNDKALNEFKKSLSKNLLSNDDEKSEAAEICIKIAEIKLADGKYNEVIEWTTKATGIYDKLPTIYSLSATAKIKLNNKNGAINDYKKLISIDKKNISAFINLTKILYENENYDESIAIAKNGLVIDNNNYELLSIIANSYYKQEKYVDAITWYKRMILINDINIGVYHNIGICSVLNNNYDEAIRYFNKVIELDSEFLDSYYELGLIYFIKEDFDMARESFSKVLAKNPNYPQKNEIEDTIKLMDGEEEEE